MQTSWTSESGNMDFTSKGSHTYNSSDLMYITNTTYPTGDPIEYKVH